MGFCNPFLKRGSCSVFRIVYRILKYDRKKRKKITFYQDQSQNIGIYKVSKIYFGKFRARLSSWCNRAFPLTWLGEIPCVSANGGEKGNRFAQDSHDGGRIRVKWSRSGLGVTKCRATPSCPDWTLFSQLSLQLLSTPDPERDCVRDDCPPWFCLRRKQVVFKTWAAPGYVA